MRGTRRRGFKFLEHTADVYIASYGENLSKAFENAALALFETMTDTENVEPNIEEEIEATGYDKLALLYDWLEELLIRFETSGNLYSRFEISQIESTTEGLRLRAKIYGEPFAPDKHKQKVGIKAVTYHRMEIQENPKKVILRFILDI